MYSGIKRSLNKYLIRVARIPRISVKQEYHWRTMVYRPFANVKNASILWCWVWDPESFCPLAVLVVDCRPTTGSSVLDDLRAPSSDRTLSWTCIRIFWIRVHSTHSHAFVLTPFMDCPVVSSPLLGTSLIVLWLTSVVELNWVHLQVPPFLQLNIWRRWLAQVIFHSSFGPSHTHAAMLWIICNDDWYIPIPSIKPS